MGGRGIVSIVRTGRFESILQHSLGDGGDGGVQGSCVRGGGDGCQLWLSIRAHYRGAGVHDLLRHTHRLPWVCAHLQIYLVCWMVM